MALLGLTATSQAASSFNTQISVSAQQERAANLAQTSTADDMVDQKTFFYMASLVVTSSSYLIDEANYYCHSK